MNFCFVCLFIVSKLRIVDLVKVDKLFLYLATEVKQRTERYQIIYHVIYSNCAAGNRSITFVGRIFVSLHVQMLIYHFKF